MSIQIANVGLQMDETFSPQSSEIDFLTRKINEESKAQNMKEEAYAFGIFLRKSPTSGSTNTIDTIVGGCNGSVVYGSIYTDQLWIDPVYRGNGLGKLLMEKVHELGRKNHCKSATVGTMSFQKAQGFYEALGYEVEFVREGYANGTTLIYLKKNL